MIKKAKTNQKFYATLKSAIKEDILWGFHNKRLNRHNNSNYQFILKKMIIKTPKFISFWL